MIRSWNETVAELRKRTRVPAALANADLLSDARKRWDGRVVARTSMHDLLFTRIGDEYPFPRTVRVAAEGDAFRFELRDSDLVITGDHATRANAGNVLDAFLLQLAGSSDEA